MNVVQSIGKIVMILIVSMTIVLLAACDGLPLTDQGTSETPAQAAVTSSLTAAVQQEETQAEATSPSVSTTVVERVEQETPTQIQTIEPDESQGETSTSPLPTPTVVSATTVGPEPTQENAASLSPVTATLIVTEQVQPTPMPLLQEASSKSYAEVLKEGEVTVGKYTFSLPQEVPDGRGRVDIVGWLPDSPDEIIDASNYQVVAINMYTGQIRQFSQSFEFPVSSGGVKILRNDRVAFLSYNPQAERATTLWVSGADNRQAQAPIRDDVIFSPVVAPSGENLILYDFETRQSQTLTSDGTLRQTEAAIATALAPLTIPQQAVDSQAIRTLGYRSTSSLTGRWTAFDNGERLVLIDLRTGETKEIAWDTSLRADSLYWSPDGQKLALLVTTGGPPIPYMKLFVLDIESEQLQELVTGFQYVTNVTWAPDSENLLISADTGIAEAEGGYEYETGNLFFIDLLTNKIYLLPLLPEGTSIGFTWKLSWAPDGVKIALGARIRMLGSDNGSQLYRIDVETP